MEYVPTKITLTAEQGFDREIALALRAEMERTGEDPRAIAVALLRAAVRAGLRPAELAQEAVHQVAAAVRAGVVTPVPAGAADTDQETA